MAADGRHRVFEFGARPERGTDVETLNGQFYQSGPSARGTAPLKP